jgi:hypothetical protein
MRFKDVAVCLKITLAQALKQENIWIGVSRLSRPSAQYLLARCALLPKP